MNTATDALTTNDPKTGGGHKIGQSSSDLVAFHGSTPTDQCAALTAQLTTITIADAAGTPDYALSALTTTSPYGLATQAEAITLLYVIKNLQTRMLEIEAILEEKGLCASN
jgi:hypothetical protein